MSLALDLTSARQAAESIMSDTCVITRDAESTADDTLDQATGLLARPVPDTTNVYSGKCFVHPAGISPRVVVEGGEAITTKLYEATIPYTAASPVVGDNFAVTASSHDPQLVDREFRVQEVLVSSLVLSRKVLLEART